jgi:hypothetical protein
MRRIPKLGRLPTLGMDTGGGFKLPYSVDFSTLSDGALPSPFIVGATWTVSGGKAVNTPTLGANLVTNGEFTTTKDNWTASNTVLNQRDSAVTPGAVSGGADNGCLEANDNGAAACAFQNITTVANRWYKFGVRLYSPSANAGTNTAGSRVGSTSGGGGGEYVPAAQTTAEDEWQARSFAFYTLGTLAAARLDSTASTGDLSYFDAVTMKQLTGECNLLPASQALATVKAAYNLQVGEAAGVVMCADARDSSIPDNCVFAYVMRVTATTTKAWLVKVVNGTPTVLINGTVVAYGAGNYIEVRHTDTETFQLFYGGAQVGADQTISDAEIITNSIHGILDTGGGNSCDAFFCGAS